MKDLILMMEKISTQRMNKCRNVAMITDLALAATVSPVPKNIIKIPVSMNKTIIKYMRHFLRLILFTRSKLLG